MKLKTFLVAAEIKMKGDVHRCTQIPHNSCAHTNLLLVTDPIGGLQARLQESKAQFVYGRFVEIVLHKTVTGRDQSQSNLYIVEML